VLCRLSGFTKCNAFMRRVFLRVEEREFSVSAQQNTKELQVLPSQRSLQNESIFRLLLKVAVIGAR
jgi:hypothetical protein